MRSETFVRQIAEQQKRRYESAKLNVIAVAADLIRTSGEDDGESAKDNPTNMWDGSF